MVDEEKLVRLATEGLLTDGGHHKQWYLEQILIELEVNLNELEEELEKEDFGWERGIAP